MSFSKISYYLGLAFTIGAAALSMACVEATGPAGPQSPASTMGTEIPGGKLPPNTPNAPALVAKPGTANAPAKTLLSAAFIQYQQWMMQIDTKAWIAEAEAMKNAGINTIILQYMKYDTQRFFTVNYKGYDPTETLMSYADQNGMKVIMGGRFNSQWWNRFTDDEFLKATVTADARFADTLYKRYGKHKSFSGWYIPYEVPEFDLDESEIQSLNLFFKNMNAELKKLSGAAIPTSVSTYFKGELSAEALEKIFTPLFEKTGVDIMLAQDSVGANAWSGNGQGGVKTSEKAKPYMEAFARVARATKMRFWPVLELFATVPEDASKPNGPTKRITLGIEQLKEQFRLAIPETETFVGFDFFHYFSPNRSDAHKAIYNSYVDQCVKVGGCVDLSTSNTPNK